MNRFASIRIDIVGFDGTQGEAMSLSRNEFRVLFALDKDPSASQRATAETAGVSVGTVNRLIRKFEDMGLMDRGALTAEGEAALAPYHVDNAVIMAAGLSSRFVPLSYEKPKGLLRVRGEVLIERQIRQLREAGIDDITVVVGYMKEAFFYLEEKFGVRIAVNPDYAKRNNNSTLMLVRERLGNTYVCSSDDYFTENVFERYVYEAYYAASYFEGPTGEYCLTTARDGRITKVSVGGHDAWAMLGHVYFDRAFSREFVRILEEEYDRPDTAPKLWEDIYREHLDDLRMTMRRYEAGVVFEFDSLADLTSFDQDFLENVDSEILDNICTTLSCSRSDIVGIVPIKEGLTNLSFRFSVAGTEYVYRHPGVGTEEIISRQSETFSQGVAKRLGIDETFIYEDVNRGWKISRFVDNCVPFDYHNETHVTRAMEMVSRLHGCGETSEWTFDLFANASQIEDLLRKRSYPLSEDFSAMRDAAARLDVRVKADGVPPCLCHNDFYDPNFLVSGDEMYLIDWEYSAMSDYASDLGTFICCSDYSTEQAEGVLAVYFGRTPTDAELAHCLAYVALAAYYWFVWALYKEVTGDPVGEWLYLWHRYAKSYSALALDLYAKLDEKNER